MSNNELKHWKYVDRYKKNGEWIYVYPGEKAKKNAFGNVRGGTGGSLQAHQRLNREATNQVLKNSPSRNIPGNEYPKPSASFVVNDAAKLSGFNEKTAVKKLTKKQISQGIRRAKIKTLKRDAAQAISRAQDWMKKLFD